MVSRRIRAILHVISTILVAAVVAFFAVDSVFAQLNENCTISILNRTANVQPDGSWRIDNVPANFGQVRARATCTENGVTQSGQSDFFNVDVGTGVKSLLVSGKTWQQPGGSIEELSRKFLEPARRAEFLTC